MSFSHLLISLFGLLVITKEGLAIKCFQCSGITDYRCSDYFRLTRASAEDCNGSCVKYRGMRPTQVGDIVDITRLCIQQSTEQCIDTQFNGIDVHACMCNTDFCNGALRMSASLFGVVLSSLTLLYFLGL